MSKLISGKEALIALANGEEVEYTNSCTPSWHELSVSGISINEIVNPKFNKFRLKPNTITINGVELNQCYSVAIDYTKNEVKVEFKNRNDAEALHDVISKLYGFK